MIVAEKSQHHVSKVVGDFSVELDITVSTNTSSVFASDHHITVISEGSFDTEDWSNDAEIQL